MIGPDEMCTTEVLSFFYLFFVPEKSIFTSCRDGRIKVIGGDNIEGLLLSPKELPFKNLEVCVLIRGD